MRNKFVKNWKMFNESFKDMFGDEMEEFRRAMIEMNKEIANVYERSSGQMEKDLRSRGPMYRLHIEALTNIHTGVIGIRIQTEALGADNLPDEVKPRLLEKLEETKQKNISYMLEKDIKKGILSWLNEFANEAVIIMTDWAKSQMEDEDDLSVIIKQSDEREPSKSDILKEIDVALDKRDFKRVAELNKMLDNMNESLDAKDEMEAKKTAEEIAGLFMKFFKEVVEKIISEKTFR